MHFPWDKPRSIDIAQKTTEVSYSLSSWLSFSLKQIFVKLHEAWLTSVCSEDKVPHFGHKCHVHLQLSLTEKKSRQNPKESKKLRSKNRTEREENGHQMLVHNTLKQTKQGQSKQN